MVKTLRIMLVSVIALICGNAMAQKVTIDFNNDYKTLFPSITGESSSDSHDGDITVTTTSTPVEGVTVTVSPKEESNPNANRIWNSDPRLRMYSGTITFTSTDENITKMVITRSTNASLVANNNTVDSGELTTATQQSNGKVTWTGDAKSVTITIAGNTQFSKVELTLGESTEDPDEPDVPNYEGTGEGTQESPYNVARALSIISVGDYTNDEVYVSGIISEITEISLQYGNATYFISDDGTTAKQLEIYRGYSLEGNKFTSENEINIGDKVIVCGKLTNYNGTYEFTTGSKIVSLTTGISDIKADMKNAPIYNLNGQRVDNPKKGLYIIGGKKYVVK